MENTKRNNKVVDQTAKRRRQRKEKAQKQRILASQANTSSETPNLSSHKAFLKTFMMKAISLVTSIVKMFDEITDEVKIPKPKFKHEFFEDDYPDYVDQL